MSRRTAPSAIPLPLCNASETQILQLRTQGESYREISRVTGIAPRKVWDHERRAMTRIIDLLEKSAFLGRV